MKEVHLTELRSGDVFTKELKLQGRKAYEVIEPVGNNTYALVRDRSMMVSHPTKMSATQNPKVIYLRNIYGLNSL